MGVLYEVYKIVEKKRGCSVELRGRFKGLVTTFMSKYRVTRISSVKMLYFIKKPSTGKMYYSPCREVIISECEKIWNNFVKDFELYIQDEYKETTVKSYISRMFIIYWNVMMVYNPFNENFEKIMERVLREKGFAKNRDGLIHYKVVYRKFKEFCKHKQIKNLKDFVEKYLGNENQVINYKDKNISESLFNSLWNLPDKWLKNRGFYILERKYGYNMIYDNKFSAVYIDKIRGMEVRIGTKRVELYRDGELIFKLVLKKKKRGNLVEIYCDVEKCKEEPFLKEEILYGVMKRLDQRFTF